MNRTAAVNNTDKPKALHYADVVTVPKHDGSKIVIHGADNKCEYTEVHPVSLPEHKPRQMRLYMNMPSIKPRLAYEDVTVDSGMPVIEIFEVLEDHKCLSMCEERLTVRRGDFVQAEKTESTRALCMLVDQKNSPTGWIPMTKLKPVYTNARNTQLNTNNPPPVVVTEAPALPPKNSCSKSEPWFVGVMSRSDCERIFKECAKQCNFIVRESTYRHGDYTLSVQYEGSIHHFPIHVTEDKRYYIGKYKFKHLSDVIQYYKQYPLFYDDCNKAVLLGEPLSYGYDHSK